MKSREGITCAGVGLAGNDTKIVAGRGQLGNKADPTNCRDMSITLRDRVEKMKSAGKSDLGQEAVSKKPLADLDRVWGDGFINIER